MKRGRGDGSLSGGTGDVNPQWLVFNGNLQSAPNTFTEDVINTPISRFPQGKGKSVVLEILKVQFDVPAPDINGGAGGTLFTTICQLTTNSQNGIIASGVQIIAYKQGYNRGAFTAAGTYESSQDGTWLIDLTDGAGHGILVATDQMYFGVNTVNFNAAATFRCRMLYRFKLVSLEEYIGIVQSQQ
jgi:hypothetical protein